MSEDNTGNNKGRFQQKGCFISYTKGAILITTAIAAIVIVALTVHYAGRGSTLCPDSVLKLKESCTKFIKDGNSNICKIAEPTRVTPPSRTEGRLPRDVKPLLYTLELFPDIYGEDPSKFTFSGILTIKIKCLIPTSEIVMNINKIEIDSRTIFFSVVDQSVGSSPAFVRMSIDTKWQFLKLELDEAMTKNTNYTISMNFTGPLKTDFAGFYLSTYRRRTVNRYLAATQFSPTDARKAFPCFDEPDRKAQFDITLVRRKDFKSLSNMPIIRSEERADELVADVYERTPLMSTYLLAFVVGDVVHADRQARPGLKFTGWADKASINKTATALNIGAEVLAYFEEYFGIPFPLPKQDMLAVPETAVGAMENWGLIIYNEDRIYYDSEEYSSSSLRNSAITIAHEIAHQWFGNLVTMKWWGDLTLKEGFAVYFAKIGIQHVYPEWNIMNQFPIARMHSVFETDSLTSSHPIHMNLSDTTEIRQVFDRISYSKGGTIIRMLNCILGDDIFRHGLKRYLKDYQYSNVDFDDLWLALGNETSREGYPLDIKGIMDTWVLQMNYPVVKMTMSGQGRLHITQERFLKSNSSVDTGKYQSPFGYVWRIPITYTTSEQQYFNQTYRDILWMNKNEMEIIDPKMPDMSTGSGWIVGNVQQWGYYRVNYDLDNWSMLVKQLKTDHQAIHVVNRGQIINDAWSLTKASHLPLEVALQTLEYLDKELDYVPWVAATKEIGYVDTFLQRSPLYNGFKTFINSITRSPFLQFGMDRNNLSHTDSLTRASLVSQACQYEISECISKSRELFQKWMTDPVNNRFESHKMTCGNDEFLLTEDLMAQLTSKKVIPDLRSSIYCTTLREGSEMEWEFVYNQYQLTSDVKEKFNLLAGLACPKNTVLLERLLNYSLDANIIQRQDAIYVINYVSKNKNGNHLAWNLLSSKWDYFLEAYSGSLFSLTKLVQSVTSTFTTQDQLTELNEFISKTKDLGTASRAFEQAVEKTKSNIRWIKDNYDVVSNWLKQYSM